MPNLNGYELCTKLTQLNPKLEVILILASDKIKCDTSKYTLIKKAYSSSTIATDC